MADSIPRRARMDQWSRAEHAINDAVQVVEGMGADERLTRAVILLGDARNQVADYVDAEGPVEPDLLPCPFCGEEPHLHRPSFSGDHFQIGCNCGQGDDSDHGALWRNGKTFEEAAEGWNRREAAHG